MKESIKRAYTYFEFLHLFPYCSEEVKTDLVNQLDKAQKPEEIGGTKVPDNLNEVSYGLLDDLANISSNNEGDPIVSAICLILDIEPEKVYNANVFDVFGMSKWIGEEVKKINRLFDRISPSYSPEELAAGVKSLNFGSFGVLDWYANRQRISDQNLVRDVAWVRIYTCMKNDNQKAEFNKRLNKQYHNKISNGKRKR